MTRRTKGGPADPVAIVDSLDGYSLPVIVQDANGRAIELDTATGNQSGYIVVVDIAHHKAHTGNHYFCSDYDSDIDTTPVKYWLVIAPDNSTSIHFLIQIRATKNGLVEFYEAPTISDNGTQLNTYNNNRRSANTPQLACYRDPTIADDGTLLKSFVIGEDITGEGGLVDREQEIGLAQNTSYIIKFTSLNNNNRVTIQFDWYEV